VPSIMMKGREKLKAELKKMLTKKKDCANN
jgi:hypothetical protein